MRTLVRDPATAALANLKSMGYARTAAAGSLAAPPDASTRSRAMCLIANASTSVNRNNISKHESRSILVRILSFTTNFFCYLTPPARVPRPPPPLRSIQYRLDLCRCRLPLSRSAVQCQRHQPTRRRHPTYRSFSNSTNISSCRAPARQLLRFCLPT